MPAPLASALQLATFAADIDARPIALDTEFIREKTFYPQLALVQCSQGDGEVLIDPVALPDPGAFGAALQGPTLKLMHSPGEDLQALRRGWNVLVEPIFDTQVAAALCGVGHGMGYQALVDAVLGVRLEKGETRSDWLRRPLSDAQLRYAAEDVRYLHAELDARLQLLGRRDWLAQECARMVDAARDDAPDPQPHLSLRSAQGLPREIQARLRRLLRWRESAAQRADRPKSWMLDNELLNQLALRPPARREELDARLDAHPRAPRRQREDLWELIAAPLTAEESEMPLAQEFDGSLRQALKRLQTAVAEVAAGLGLPESLLASRRHLETLLVERSWPTALNGWRRGLLENRLLTMLPD